MDQPDDWAPEPGKEEWWRNIRDGQRGYRIRKGGMDFIRLDRPEEEILLPLKGNQWTIDRDLRPLHKHRCAMIAHAADRMLLIDLGYHGDASKAWHELLEPERIRFMEKGPEDMVVRNNLFAAIMRELEPLTK